MKLLPVLVAVMLAPTTAVAGPASDAIRFFYSPPSYEPDPSVRDRFVDPARTKFEENDKANDGGETCFDWVLAIDAQDLDEAELARTLQLDETVSGDDAEVIATFTLFPGQRDARREIVWSLRNIDGDWKVSDIESRTNDWKLTELGCS